MSFNFSTISNWFATTERDVVAVIAALRADLQVAEQDVEAALNWLAGEVPNIVAGLQTALGLATAVGVVTAPELLAANAAVAALNAFAQAHNASVASGDGGLSTSAKAVVAGYVAYTQAASAVNAAKATAAQAVLPPPHPVPAPAPAPSPAPAPAPYSDPSVAGAPGA